MSSIKMTNKRPKEIPRAEFWVNRTPEQLAEDADFVRRIREMVAREVEAARGRLEVGQ